MWNAAFKKNPWAIPRWDGHGKTATKSLAGFNTCAVLQPSDARITGYSPTPIESSLTVTPMNYSTSYLLAAA